MRLDSHRNWLRRSIVCAVLSAAALSLRPLQSLQPFYWAPGILFAVLVVAARADKPELLAAVTLSYGLGYASGNVLEPLGTWPMRIGVVAIGSGLLALSLRWKGGLTTKQASDLSLLGTLLAIPFWLVATSSNAAGAPPLPVWIAAFSVWQIPMAWYYLKKG